MKVSHENGCGEIFELFKRLLGFSKKVNVVKNNSLI
jgi:hypothetical protein